MKHLLRTALWGPGTPLIVIGVAMMIVSLVR